MTNISSSLGYSQRNMVAYDEHSRPSLLKALTLGDALRDLPPVRHLSLICIWIRAKWAWLWMVGLDQTETL